MIVTVTLTPALDKTVILPDFRVDEVNRIQSIRLDAGGKGINVSKGLRALGVDSLATGILGGDTGRYIEKSLHETGISCDFVWTERDTRTNLKVVDPVRHTNTDINEPGAPVDEETLETVYRKAEAASYFLPLIFVAFYSINFESLPIAVPKERILRCRILSFGGAGGIYRCAA